jgi:hypothetical protein
VHRGLDVPALLRLDRAGVRGVERAQGAAVAQQQRGDPGGRERLGRRQRVSRGIRAAALLVTQQPLELLDAVAPQLIVGASLFLLIDARV